MDYQVEDVYDYVIVGGTAGLTVGDRLSESGRYTVLVTEYGVLYNSTAILNGGVLGGGDPSRQFDIPSVPQPELNNRSINVRVRKAVGGSSTINGLQLLRGTSDEYDMWAGLGAENSTWNWAGLLPYFKKASTPIQNSVHFVSPPEGLAREFNITYDVDAAWGEDPPHQLYAVYPNYQPPEIKLMYDAMHKMPNVDFPRDGNAGTNGVYWYPSTMDPRTYTRSYALLFGNDVATGLTFVPVNGSEATTVRVRKEVILAAGTIHTPQILQLSGIGPASLLQKANIMVKVDLPGVSANFQDHGYIPGVNFKWTTQPPVPVTKSGGDPSTMLTRNLGAFLGLPTISPSEVNVIAAKYEIQDSTDYLPKDSHADILAGYKAQKAVFTRILKSKNVSMLWQILQANPPADPVFQHPVSRSTSIFKSFRYRDHSPACQIRPTLFTSEAYAPYGPVETSPGANITTDSQLKAWVKEKYVASVYHPVGTASLMRRELGGVVGEDLLVYGVRGLSVVDASVIPIIPGCPTALTVYTIAEKAADLIKAQQ
ncbi:hypothetical protein DL95DRAFT_461693 [Leptodontidium sp. 2 PMI_412]|nr:hypothetical protein DL95DRAFT_461693 [Leptodontidium sp. 2 PMI_412]